MERREGGGKKSEEEVRKREGQKTWETVVVG